ncbi:MAG: BREX system ATP-binding protein BrxD [Planctomycetota bacterium]
MISAQRRLELIDALRRGTVPQRSLDVLAIGLGRFEAAIDEELERVAKGGAGFKAVRGEYGSGKTFFARWLQERAKKAGFVTAEVQISEMETPLHRLETVYRRLMERLSTPDQPSGAFRSIVDLWVYTLEQDVLAGGSVAESDEAELARRVDELMEKRLARVSQQAPMFAAALRGYRSALAQNDAPTAEAVLAWVAGQPNVAAASRKVAGVKGEIDHFGALSFLQGLLTLLRDSGQSGLVLVLDEVETLQRVRGDVRDKGLNALRQLMDEVDGGRFPGLYLVLTGTPAFYDGPQGVQRLPPLAQRVQADFTMDARFDNPRAPQIRLTAFDMEKLGALGCRVRDLFLEGRPNAERLRQRCDDAYVGDLARALTGELGGKVGVAPRLFLRKLVDVLDRVDQFEEFLPRRDYALKLEPKDLDRVEAAAVRRESVEDIELELPGESG